MKTSKILAAVATATVAASCVAVSASAYTAYLGFQTAPYSFRNAWDDGSYGLASGYYDSAIVWGSGDAPEETYPDYADNFDWDINGYALPVSYTDAAITADGTYTVSVEGMDWALDGASSFNLLFISTDIPNDGSVTIKDVKIIVDGTVTKTIETPVLEDKTYVQANLCNIWNPEVGGYDGAYPTESLAFEFTVEGLGAAGGDADTTAPADPDKGSPDTGVAGVAAVAGAAIVAGGAMMLAKKRK